MASGQEDASEIFLNPLDWNEENGITLRAKAVHGALHGAVAVGAMRARGGAGAQTRPRPATAPHVVRQRVLTLVSPKSATAASAAKTRSPAE
jgi:hypothetical protein